MLKGFTTLCVFTLCAALLPAQESESALVRACKDRIAELAQDQSKPQFEFKYLCKETFAVIYPAGHDLDFYLPTLGGASQKKVALESALQRVVDWLDSDYMRPEAETALQVFAERIGQAEPIVLIILDRIEDRNLFNLRYENGLILQDAIRQSIKPVGHEDCLGVPCAYPGSCGDNLTCAWESHVPLCEFVNRATAKLLTQRYGSLPPAFMGFAEVAEVTITGGHYCYRHWGEQRTLLSHDDRDGYAAEFERLLERRYGKKKDREPFVKGILGWEGGTYEPSQYAASWGLAQSLLGHCKEVGRGKKKKNLGDLLFQIGSKSEPTAEELFDLLLEFEPKFLSLFHKPLPKKLQKKGADIFRP